MTNKNTHNYLKRCFKKLEINRTLTEIHSSICFAIRGKEVFTIIPDFDNKYMHNINKDVLKHIYECF